MARIAIIDDDQLFRDLLVENSQLMGHETLTAGSLSDAKYILSEEAINLVFLDVRLPDGKRAQMVRITRKAQKKDFTLNYTYETLRLPGAEVGTTKSIIFKYLS